jgi:hypothetical protein
MSKKENKRYRDADRKTAPKRGGKTDATTAILIHMSRRESLRQADGRPPLPEENLPAAGSLHRRRRETTGAGCSALT